jgi:hypothetical protein
VIHDIGKQLQAQLRLVGCPLPVIDGPEGTETTTFSRERIVIQYAEQGDSFERAPRGTSPRNPHHRWVRWIGFELRIFVQSPHAGAQEFEHRRRADHALDLVVNAIDKVIEKRLNRWRIQSGSYAQPIDLEKSEKIGGTIYVLRFDVDRAMQDQQWNGDSAVTLGSIASAAHSGVISIDGFVTTEPNCGA